MVWAGDHIGAAIARRVAAEGYTVFCGRRNGEKLGPLVAEIEGAGGVCVGRSLDARQEEQAARVLLRHGRGSIFLTGATASVRGGMGYAAFASAKFGLRAVAQSLARELGPRNIHVAHPVIDSGVDTAWVRGRVAERNATDPFVGERLEPDRLLSPATIAETYWQLHRQPRDGWTHELDIRPSRETW